MSIVSFLLLLLIAGVVGMDLPVVWSIIGSAPPVTVLGVLR